jgi:hypothetical protein
MHSCSPRNARTWRQAGHCIVVNKAGSSRACIVLNRIRCAQQLWVSQERVLIVHMMICFDVIVPTCSISAVVQSFHQQTVVITWLP